MKTIYVKVKDLLMYEGRVTASAGPHANITGMRKVWSHKGLIVKSGVYIYKIQDNENN